MTTCQHCGVQIHNDPTDGVFVWVDNLGSDVCGWGGAHEHWTVGARG